MKWFFALLFLAGGGALFYHNNPWFVVGGSAVILVGMYGFIFFFSRGLNAKMDVDIQEMKRRREERVRSLADAVLAWEEEEAYLEYFKLRLNERNARLRWVAAELVRRYEETYTAPQIRQLFSSRFHANGVSIEDVRELTRAGFMFVYTEGEELLMKVECALDEEERSRTLEPSFELPAFA